LLEETLNEEYEADNRLTALAVARLNKKAEEAGEKLTPSDSTIALQENDLNEEEDMPAGKRPARELELVSDKNKTSGNKREAAAKQKAPKGEAGRSEKPRPTASKTRTTANSNNSKSAKVSGQRKTTDGRSGAGKNKRAR
jgi:hypothetical protein